MKKIFLMLLTVGLISFGSTSCGSSQENGDEERMETTEDEAEDADAPDMEEEADEAEDGNDKNDPR